MWDADALELNRPVRWEGRDCVLRGMDPMSLPERRAELEDTVTGERFQVDLGELCTAIAHADRAAEPDGRAARFGEFPRRRAGLH